MLSGISNSGNNGDPLSMSQLEEYKERNLIGDLI